MDTTKKVSAPDSEAFIQRHYETLKDMARSRRRRTQAGHGMLTTDILHEAWLKFGKRTIWNDETHFLASAAQAMRSVIIDEARAKLTAKRGSGAEHTDFAALHDFLPDLSESPEQIVAINDLIDRLETQHPRAAHVVVLRYFGGFTDAETASLLGITDRTVRNDWQFARAWIAEQLNGHMAG